MAARTVRALSRSFNPRLPGGRRLHSDHRSSAESWCFNPRLPGGRRLDSPQSTAIIDSVSIHAFRGEGDMRCTAFFVPFEVSIHAFRGEGDTVKRAPGPACLWFQSTPSGGKATRPCCVHAGRDRVSIHAFRGEGDSAGERYSRPIRVSIHAFRGEGDDPASPTTARCHCFNPRLPGGRRLYMAIF